MTCYGKAIKRSYASVSVSEIVSIGPSFIIISSYLHLYNALIQPIDAAHRSDDSLQGGSDTVTMK